MPSKKKQAEVREEKEWESVNKAFRKSGNFMERNQKFLSTIVIIIVVIVVIVVGFQHLYRAPKEKQAEVALFRGEEYFRAGKDSVALYGDGAFVGFETIIKNYSSTKAGSLARLYAGLCYANLQQYNKALAYLQGFSAGDKIVSNLVYGAMGDCYVNTGKVQAAIPYFIKAAEGVDNQYQSPLFYKKAALIYRDQKQYDEEIRLLEIIKNRYAKSKEALTIDKYIQEAKALQGSK